MRSIALWLTLSVVASLPGSALASDDAPEAHPLDRAGDVLLELVPHVESACGASFPSPPVVLELSPARARSVFAADLRTEIARGYPGATARQIDALVDVHARSSVASCLARYSFAKKAVILVRDSFDAQRQGAGFSDDEAPGLLAAVLAHEAVHALDDARFDLRRFYAEAPDQEALRARAMIAEGRAVHFGRIAAAAFGAPEKARDLLPGGSPPRNAGAWLMRLTYELGAAYIAELSAGAADELFAHPPAATLHVLRPATAERPDRRPARVLSRALPDAEPRTLSALQLRARYAALADGTTSAALLAGFAGGTQTLADDTNAVVLAFDDEAAAETYRLRAEKDAPTCRVGTLVLRAFGPAAERLLGRLTDAAEAESLEPNSDE